jgi:PAS domain S-box-containing protein
VEFLQTIANVVGVLKERERALSGLHMRERALDSISQGITITDESLPEPAIIYTNPAFARMSGYAVSEITGMPSSSFMTSNPPPGLAERLALARAERREVRFDSPAKRKNGSTFLDHVTASPIVNADGDLTNYVSIHEDITEARQRDERLHESQKMEAVGQLTGGIAHDFNNLLTVVRANAEDMREELKDSPLLHRQADMVLQAATRGADLVQQLMAFARKQELEPKVVDINAMLEAFTNLVRRTLQENVRMEVVKDKNIPVVKVDPGRLENAILNLSINARDAMPDGGTITIETGTVTLDAAYEVENPGIRAGKYVLIAVSDTGIGMTKDVMEKAFQPFFTTKEVGQGTGLGLSMVYGFVKQSGGHAKIYSEVGRGTTVKIFLPPTQESLLDDAATEDRAVQTQGSGKILLVEDDDLVRESVESKLLRLGYTVTPVCSAAEAIQMLERNPHFDLVFTDVIMPGAMTGADLTRDVMRRWPGIKVLMTSGYTEASALGKVKMPEGVRLLSKPYSNADLANAFRDVLESVTAV